MNREEKFMQRAIELAEISVENGGGPFGAVIVKNGEIIAEASNRVTQENDPTAHAEVVAIRKAASKMKEFSLEECEIYASCEPCPMCLSAIYWARIPIVYYGADRHDAEAAGFDDSFIYDQLSKPETERTIRMAKIVSEKSLDAFKKWNDVEDKTRY